MAKLFILGITGYVGGDTLYEFTKAHPEWSITALVRSPEKGKAVTKQYPQVKLVYGTLEDDAIIKSEAAKADIVVHLADADHVGSIESILEGLKGSHSADKPAYFIFMSGTGSFIPISMLTDPTKLGYLPPDGHVFNDWDGRKDAYELTDEKALHKAAELAMISAEKRADGAVRTAIVSPASIYGTTRGPLPRLSMVAPAFARIMFTEGAGCLLADGTNPWNNLHVADVSALLRLLVEAAVQGGGTADWGHDGYYLAESGSLVQRDIWEQMTKHAVRMGLLSSTELKPITPQRAVEIVPAIGAVILGSSSQSQAIRAHKKLGWTPKGKSHDEELPALLEQIAREMGMWKGN